MKASPITALVGAPETATRFAWRCLGGEPWPPPVPKRGPQYGPDRTCWLCGGPTDGVGWPWQAIIAPTFTNHTLAKAPSSQSVCQPCAYFAGSESWYNHAASHNAAHPERPPLKAVQPLSWRSYPQLFTAGGVAHPTRAAWRAVLLAPPAPPFLALIPTSGQKHLIFRATVSYSVDDFVVLLEEESLWIHRATFAALLGTFEAMYALGFSKASILSGDYHPAQLLKVGTAVWRPLDVVLRQLRRQLPGLMRLAEQVAQRPQED